eukprot:712780-Pelagomonas_calceolata.AAC.7
MREAPGTGKRHPDALTPGIDESVEAGPPNAPDTGKRHRGTQLHPTPGADNGRGRAIFWH